MTGLITPCWWQGAFTVDLADLIPLTKSGRPIGRGWFGRNRTKTLTPEMAASHSERVGVYGHRTGWLASGIFLVVFDCDVKHGIDGISNFLAVGNSPTTLSQETKSGGRHYFFMLDLDRAKLQTDDARIHGNRVNIMPGVDVRGEGGFVRLYEKDLNIMMVEFDAHATH